MKRNAKKKSEPKSEQPDVSRRNRFVTTEDDGPVIIRKATDEEMETSRKMDEKAKRKTE